MRELRVGRIRVQFFVNKHAELTPTRQLLHAYAPLEISSPEATALDLLRYAWRIGGIHYASQVIKKLVSTFTKTGLRQAFQAEYEHATLQRLGYILEKFGLSDLCLLVEKQLPKKLNRVFLEHHAILDSARPLCISNRWGLIINTEITDSS
jgi:hypothetical protein